MQDSICPQGTTQYLSRVGYVKFDKSVKNYVCQKLHSAIFANSVQNNIWQQWTIEKFSTVHKYLSTE